MAESFGGRLRRQREAQGIALAAIAEQTKIKESLLEALERDDLSHWPSGIFRRAYVRAYAHAAGLPPDAVLREFLEQHPDPVEDPTPLQAIRATVDARAASAGPPTRLRVLVGSAMASLARLRRQPEADAPAAPGAGPARGPADPDRAATEPGPEIAAPVADVPVAPMAAAPHRGASHPGVDGEASSDGDAAGDGSAASHVASISAAEERPNLLAFANVCREIGRVEDAGQLQLRLQEAAGVLGARGAIVWLWDAAAGGLRPALACGYPGEAIAQLPVVAPDEDNATAAAFRSAEPCAIDGGGRGHGALVVPLLGPGGCAGVLALELDHGAESRARVRAAAIILAALLVQLIGPEPVGTADEQP